MDRGVYFDGWFKHNHCYHPSLPLRSEQMLGELERIRGNVLVWAGLGGGSISLPWLEHEAFGPVDPRMQMYGYMNDRDFIRECGKRGIRVFGVVFEVQGWEFPAVIDAETGRLLRMNRFAEQDGAHGWYGLREFSQDTYPDAFPTSLKDYYPDGIRTPDGKPVTDIREECCCRDLHGVPIHAKWVEIRDHAQECYQMCRNQPVWREYLKKIIRLQIDAGVQGLQLDECELPMIAIGSGGCFCDECVRQFTEYLRERKARGKLGPEWDGIDLDTFNYRDYLLERGCDFPSGAPFFRDYWEYQVFQVRRYFSELVDFAKAYAREKDGRELPVSGNFYNLQPAYYPIEPKADILITEMEHTLFRQPHFYRYCAGYARKKTMIIAENPYGGVVPALVKMLDRGRAYDLYRLFLLEASAYGCNMAVPYGGWMGNTVRDAFYPPRALTAEIQDFLAAHEDFYPKDTQSGACVLYSFGSYYWREATRGGGSGGNGMQDSPEDLPEAVSVWEDPSLKRLPFWDVIREMSARGAVYDVRMMPDGEFRPDDFSAADLEGCRLIVIPDCNLLTESQAALLEEKAREGCRLLVYGRLAENTDLAARLRALGTAVFVPLSEEDLDGSLKACMEAFDALYGEAAPVRCSHPALGLHRFDRNGKAYVHLLNYDYRAAEDRVVPAENVTVRLREAAGAVRVFTLEGERTDFDVRREGEETVVTLPSVPVYTVITVGA